MTYREVSVMKKNIIHHCFNKPYISCFFRVFLFKKDQRDKFRAMLVQDMPTKAKQNYNHQSEFLKPVNTNSNSRKGWKYK